MASKFRPLGGAGDLVSTFSSEEGAHYRGHHQELAPAMRRVKQIQELQARRGRGKLDKEYMGSVPVAVLTDWLTRNGYTKHEWAINAGGDPYNKFAGGPGVYDKFLSFFLSRDWAKLHTQHVTTKRESNVVTVPADIQRKAVNLAGIGDGKLRTAKG